MAYRRRRSRRNPEYKGWRRIAAKKDTADAVGLISAGFLAWMGYKIYQWWTTPETPALPK